MTQYNNILPYTTKSMCEKYFCDFSSSKFDFNISTFTWDLTVIYLKVILWYIFILIQQKIERK